MKNGWLTKVICGLALAFILGGIGLAIAQGSANEKITTLKDVQDRNQSVIDSVDVIQSDVARIKEDLEKLDSKIDRQHSEVMSAIRNN